MSQPALADVTPQAIFWRDIGSFALRPDAAEDDLDTYLVASFIIGNAVTFDIRHYDGHPKATATVYLPSATSEPVEIEEALRQVIEGLRVPESGIAWRRGQNYEFGYLPRNSNDRLREAEARVLALKIAAECDNYVATTEYIKRRVPELVPLTAKDLEQSASRPREKLWQQIVGNVISHKPGNRSIFTQGLAERTVNGLKVTEQGINYLNSIGFLS
ncbi:hypothetical protein [Sphingomonas sp. Leaf25]|uniref:hypothetical protein n=1 Tax=Sphingomonas sp. Leaf25 TaxID=1735692 RepID=UPI0012E23BB1|nr:hypothetical protein [Sphingomonas sp. Leaf25]